MAEKNVIAFTTKKEYAAQFLREQIISGELPAGSRVMQREIAEELAVSVTPVREAIRQLETEGYLESIAHVGVRVSRMHRDGLEEVYHLRCQLEGDLAEQAARLITDEQAAEIKRRAMEFRVAVHAGDRVGARRSNYRFHLAIWEAARRPITLELVNALWAKFPWDTLDDMTLRGPESIKEHDELLEALEERDPVASRQAEVHHISASLAYLNRNQQSQPSVSG